MRKHVFIALIIGAFATAGAMALLGKGVSQGSPERRAAQLGTVLVVSERGQQAVADSMPGIDVEVAAPEEARSLEGLAGIVVDDGLLGSVDAGWLQTEFKNGALVAALDTTMGDLVTIEGSER